MSIKQILIIIACFIIIFYISYLKLKEENDLLDELNRKDNLIENEYDSDEYDSEEYDSEENSVENFQLYTDPCKRTSLDKCFSSYQCGIASDYKNRLYCQRGGLDGPYDYPTNSWIYNGKCWGKDCDYLLPTIAKLSKPFDPYNKINPYPEDYKITF